MATSHAAIKVGLSGIPETAIRKAQKAHTPIVALVNMTQEYGHLSCATLKPPDVQCQFWRSTTLLYYRPSTPPS